MAVNAKFRPVTQVPHDIPFFKRKIMLYGPLKEGKTTLVSQIPKILFFAFERGHDDVSGDIFPLEKWEDFVNRDENGNLRDCAWKWFVEEGKNNYNMFAIDTLDAAHMMFNRHFLAKNKIAYEGEDKMRGRGWVNSRREFRNAMLDLQFPGVGYWLICHETVDEITDTDGKVIKSTIRANYSNSTEIRSATAGIVDAIWRIETRPHLDGDTMKTGKVLLCGNVPNYEVNTRFKMPSIVSLADGDPQKSIKIVAATYAKFNLHEAKKTSAGDGQTEDAPTGAGEKKG